MKLQLDRRTRTEDDVEWLTPTVFFDERFPRAPLRGTLHLLWGKRSTSSCHPLWTIPGRRRPRGRSFGDGPTLVVVPGVAHRQPWSSASPRRNSPTGVRTSARSTRTSWRARAVAGGNRAGHSYLGLSVDEPVVRADRRRLGRLRRPQRCAARSPPILHARRRPLTTSPTSCARQDSSTFRGPARARRLMPLISADMDRVLPTYVEGDGKSGWAQLLGRHSGVRAPAGVLRRRLSSATVQMLSSKRWQLLRVTRPSRRSCSSRARWKAAASRR